MIALGEYAIKLDALSPGTQGIGLKAGRLGSMLSSGLPLPSGFVIKAEAFDRFLRHNKIASKISATLEESHSAGFQRLKEMSGRIQNLIINGIMPDYIEKQIKDEYQDLSIGREAKEIGGVALDLIRAGRDNILVSVRPSPVADTASANFSGQMRTLLYLRGQQQISYAIKEVWASLFSLRAMLYRKRRRMREMPSMGVIIQKSLEPDKSGFVYTSIPETGDASRVVIEGSWGFSDSIISGMVAPDEYVISKETGETEHRKIRKKMWMKKMNEMSGKIEREPVFRERVGAELLDSKEIKKLMELAARVEKNREGQPQQIEWAEERGRLFIIDSEHIPDYGVAKEPGAQQNGAQQGHESIARGTCVYRGDVKGTARVFSSMSDLERIERGNILVTKMTLDEMLPVMDNISGMITEDGSRSCHSAVLAREFGIPAIVSSEGATSSVHDGQEIVLDASRGSVSVVRNVPEPVQEQWGGQGTPVQHPLHPEAHMHDIPPFPGRDNPQATPPEKQHDAGISNGGQIPRGLDEEGVTATGIRSTVSIPGMIGRSPELSDGAGLVRAEHIITETGKHPFYLMSSNPKQVISSLIKALGSIAKTFYPKPVWYRSIDIRSDEFRELEGGEYEPSENNPLMGWHGIRRSLDQPSLLRIEIEIIERLYKEGVNNILFGIPFLSSTEEFRAVKQMVGFPLRIGAMIETPAAGLDIEGLCKEGIAFAAIGLNDLTQLTLGVDRDNPSISKLYSELNPAVINLLKHILRTCRKYSVETSVYGDFVSDPRIAESLVKLGVGSITTEPENLEEVRAIISRTERKMILENMRSRSGT